MGCGPRNAGRRQRWIGLQRSGEKMQAIFGRRHQTLEQRSVEAMQIFQRVRYSKAGPQIEMKLSVTDGGKINQDDVAICLLQRDRGIHRSRCGPGAAFGPQKSKDASLARTSASASPVGTEARQGFQKSC